MSRINLIPSFYQQFNIISISLQCWQWQLLLRLTKLQNKTYSKLPNAEYFGFTAAWNDRHNCRGNGYRCDSLVFSTLTICCMKHTSVSTVRCLLQQCSSRHCFQMTFADVGTFLWRDELSNASYLVLSSNACTNST